MTREWQKHSEYRGVQIDYRPEMKRRGWRIHTSKAIGSYRDGGVQVFDSLSACLDNIDKRMRREAEVGA